MYQNSSRPKSPGFSGSSTMSPFYQHTSIHQVAPSASASFAPRSFSSPHVTGMVHGGSSAPAAGPNSVSGMKNRDQMSRPRSMYSLPSYTSNSSAYGASSSRSVLTPASVPSSASSTSSIASQQDLTPKRYSHRFSSDDHVYSSGPVGSSISNFPGSPIVGPASPSPGTNYSFQQLRSVGSKSVLQQPDETSPPTINTQVSQRPERYHRRKSSGSIATSNGGSPSPARSFSDNPTFSSHARTTSISSNSSMPASTGSLYRNSAFASSLPVLSSADPSSTSLVHGRSPHVESSSPQLSIPKHRRTSSTNFSPRVVSNDLSTDVTSNDSRGEPSSIRRNSTLYDSDIDLHFDNQPKQLVLPSDRRRLSVASVSVESSVESSLESSLDTTAVESQAKPNFATPPKAPLQTTNLYVSVESLHFDKHVDNKNQPAAAVDHFGNVAQLHPVKQEPSIQKTPTNDSFHSAKSGPPIRRAGNLYLTYGTSATGRTEQAEQAKPTVASPIAQRPPSPLKTSPEPKFAPKISGFTRLKNAFRSSRKAEAPLNSGPVPRRVSGNASTARAASYKTGRDSDSVSLFSIQSSASTASFATLKKVGASIAKGLGRKKSESNLSGSPSFVSPSNRASAVNFSLASSQHASSDYTSSNAEPVLSHALAEGELLPNDLSAVKNDSITSTSSGRTTTSLSNSNNSSTSISSISSGVLSAGQSTLNVCGHLPASDTLKVISVESAASAVIKVEDDVRSSDELAQEAVIHGDTVFPKSLDMLAVDSFKSSLGRAKSLERRRSRRSAHKEQVDSMIKEKETISAEELTEPSAGAVASKGILKSVSGSVRSSTSTKSDASFATGNEDSSFNVTLPNDSASSITQRDIDLTYLVPIEQGDSLNLDFMSDPGLVTNDVLESSNNADADVQPLDVVPLPPPAVKSVQPHYSSSAGEAPPPQKNEFKRSRHSPHRFSNQFSSQQQYPNQANQHYQRKSSQPQPPSSYYHHHQESGRRSASANNAPAHYRQTFAKDHYRAPSYASSSTTLPVQRATSGNVRDEGRSNGVSFSSRIVVYDTYGPGDYDRRPDIATCNRLTPILAHQIKEELNNFKMEMDIHEESRRHTHFF